MKNFNYNTNFSNKIPQNEILNNNSYQTKNISIVQDAYSFDDDESDKLLVTNKSSLFENNDEEVNFRDKLLNVCINSVIIILNNLPNIPSRPNFSSDDLMHFSFNHEKINDEKNFKPRIGSNQISNIKKKGEESLEQTLRISNLKSEDEINDENISKNKNINDSHKAKQMSQFFEL